MNTYRSDPSDIQDILEKTDSLIKTFGPRLPGSASCLQTADALKQEFAKYCDRVSENRFSLHPDAFFCIPTLIAATYLLSAIALFILHAGILSISMLGFGLLYFIVQFLFFSDAFDWIFKKKPGKNVFGILEPQGETKQQIIISSHHDSTHICNFLSSHQRLYSFRIVIPICFCLYSLIASIVLTSTNDIQTSSGFYLVTMIVFAVGCFFVIPMFWYNNKKGAPGAGDNLLCSVMGIKILEIIKRNWKSLKNTRIVVLSNDGEEIGQKGAQFFVKEMKEMMKECKTYVLNIDSLYQYQELALLSSDRNGTIHLSKALTNDVKGVAEKIGYAIGSKKFPFGGGGTDAAQFAKKGIQAASIIGISTGILRDGLYYHTAKDTVERIEPKAVEAVLNIIINYLTHNDRSLENEQGRN